MGNVTFPSSLKQLASLCDCLESTERFRYEKEPTEHSEKSESQQKEEDTPKKQQLRRQPNPSIQESVIQTPQPAKLYQPLAPQPSLKRRSDLQIRQSAINLPKMDDISELSEQPNRPDQHQPLQMFQFDKDEDVRANNMFKLFNPLFHSHTEMKPFKGRRRAPLLKKSLTNEAEAQNIEISEINEAPSHDNDGQFFSNDEEKEYRSGKNNSHYH